MSTIDAAGLMTLRNAVIGRSEALRAAAAPAVAAAQPGGFAGLLDDVSRLQDRAGAASAAFERGESTDIAQVMLSRQTAGIAFEATLQVRNKLLGAYRDIMNMPV